MAPRRTGVALLRLQGPGPRRAEGTGKNSLVKGGFTRPGPARCVAGHRLPQTSRAYSRRPPPQQSRGQAGLRTRSAPQRSRHSPRANRGLAGHLPPEPASPPAASALTQAQQRGSGRRQQDGPGQRGPHREGAAARLPQAAPGPRQHYGLRPPHSFRMAPFTALPWCTCTSGLPCSSSILPEEETTEG